MRCSRSKLCFSSVIGRERRAAVGRQPTTAAGQERAEGKQAQGCKDVPSSLQPASRALLYCSGGQALTRGVLVDDEQVSVEAGQYEAKVELAQDLQLMNRRACESGALDAQRLATGKAGAAANTAERACPETCRCLHATAPVCCNSKPPHRNLQPNSRPHLQAAEVGFVKHALQLLLCTHREGVWRYAAAPVSDTAWRCPG